MGEIVKYCPDCQKEYPATVEYFTRDKSRKSGLAIYCKECNQKKKKVYNRQHPETRRAEKQRYRERYPEKNAEWIRAYRERLQNAEGTYTEEDWNTLCRHYENRCLRCKKQTELVPDHVVPLSKGGSNYIENIQPLCKNCNAIKTNRDWDFRN